MPVHKVLESVARALGHGSEPPAPPPPPTIDEPIVRLVHSDIGLPELFIRRATENKISVAPVTVDQLVDHLVAFMQQEKLEHIAMGETSFLQSLNITAGLRAAGLNVRGWDDLVLDDLYEHDCGITDVYAAVAETGSLVIRATPGQGRALSLVPVVHVAIVQPKDFVPDLVDFFQKLSRDGAPSVSIISGPSKTSDIEMTLITGVHGPRKVQVFLLH